MSGLTRHAANSGTRQMPALHMSTFGWVELIRAVSNLRSVYGAVNCDVHGLMALIRNEATSDWAKA
eukprot:8779717-Lingulodinium_polyedra.AAC.1